MSSLVSTTLKTTLITDGLPFDRHRTYLMIIARGTVTITLEGSASFDLVLNEMWEPKVVPINAITIAGQGVLISS
jgi:hypothetical protein